MLIYGLKCFLLVSSCVIFAGLSSCNERTSVRSFEIDSEEFEEIRRLARENYLLNDSKLFSEKENCFFESYLTIDLSMEGDHYDRVHDGFLIKYFYCPYNEFQFTIVKGTNDRHYYIGLADLIFNKKLYDSLYRQDEIISDEVLMLRAKKYTTSTYFNKIFDEDPYFASLNQTNKIRAAYSLVYNCYQKPVGGYHSTYTSIFDKAIDPVDVKKVFLETLIKSEEDSAKVNEVSELIHPLTFKYLDRRTKLYSVDNRGIMGFDYTLRGKTVEMHQFFLPQAFRKVEFGDDIAYSILPEDCL